MLSKVRNITSSLQSNIQKKKFGMKNKKYMGQYGFSEACKFFKSRDAVYEYMHHYSHQFLDADVIRHRNYFALDQRGFGEDAFHAMWTMLLKEFKPKSALEIGVYRGQVLSLWALLAKKFNFKIDIHGISPFTPAGDGVSDYLKNIDYYNDVLSHHKTFGINRPSLFKGFSNDPEALNYIRQKKWDLIYIDGSHDYDVVLGDYQICRDQLSDAGLLVIDDSSLYFDFNPPKFAFAGHPGPSRVVFEHAMKELNFIGGVGHNNVFMKK